MYEIFRKPQSVYNIFSANEKTANRNERKALTERIAFYDAVLDILAPRSAESASESAETDIVEPQTEVETTTETTSFTPGLVEDEYTAKLSKKRRKALHDVAVALGLRVRFVDAVRTAAGGLANADISGNEVRIAWSKRDKAISFLVGHEFTHRMQELSPKEYASFKESVKAYMGDERWNALVAKTRSIYEAHNAREMARAEAEHRAPRLLQYSVELIEDEVVADFAGELNEDANALAAFAEKLAEKPSTLKAVIAVLRDILNKLKGLVAGAEAQRLANMLSKFEELYRASASRTTEGQTQSKEKYALQTFERVTDYITYEARALGITTPIFVVENVEEFKQAMREIGVNNVDDYEKVSGVYDPDNDAIYIRADVSEYERVFFEVLLHENTHAVTASIKGKLKDVLSTLNEVDILAYRDSKLSAIYKNTSALDVLNEIISYFVQEIPQDRLIDYYQGEVDIEDTILSDFEISLIEDEAEQKFIAALRPVILDNLEIQKRNYNERQGKAIVIARGYMGPYGAEIKKSQSSSTNTEHERGNDPRGESEATRGVPQEMGTPSHQDLEHRYSLGADDVFFDDNGDVIPLSERFNPEKEDIRYSLMRPTDKEVTFDNFFANTSAVFTLLHKSEAPQREADYESERWDGLGISSRYWYGEDERGKYVVRASDHWSDYPRGANSRKAFEDNPYHRRYTRIASSRWALDMADAPNVATPRPEPRASQEEWDAYNKAQNAQRAAFEDAYIDGKAMYGKAYLDDFTKWEVEPRYSIPQQPIFYSNAEYAVRGIKQEKATPEQWLKMIEKNGGLKAGEDKWLGLSDWLKASDKKTLTKDEVLQYIAENDIQIEEVEYAQFGPGLIDEATRKLEAEMREIGIEAMREKYDGFDDLFEVYNGELLWSEERASEGEYEDFIIENNIVDVNAQANAINETRLGYTTNGLDNKREIALTVPTIEPWNTSDNIHFGDAGEGRAVAWIRFGETTDADGKRVLVIDEIQSKRHQEGRDKGYSDKRVSQQELYDAQEEAFSKVIAYESALADKYGEDEWASLASEGEMAEYERLRAIDEAATNAYENYDKGIPSAPFEKNWAELAMKRMLRYAAENGFDKVAWTTGDQQAERYDLGKSIDYIEAQRNENGTYNLNVATDDDSHYVQEDNISESRLSEVLGKDMMQSIVMGTQDSEDGSVIIEGDGLRIGGEGMKAFYDQMLPSFVRKYAKKWGATVGEVTMPDLEKNNTMHSVDVTPAMRESVMQGQPKFSMRGSDKSLVGLHNISLDKLRKAIKMGGLANPSVAIIDVDKATHEDYGDYTLVLTPNMVDARLGRNAGTWAGDAWTPTYPQVTKRIPMSKDITRFHKDINKMPEAIRNRVRLQWDSFLDGRDANSFAYWYLFEKGVAPEMAVIPPVFPDDIVKMVSEATDGTFNMWQKSDEQKARCEDAYIAYKYGGDRAAYEADLQSRKERLQRALNTTKSQLVVKKAAGDLAALEEFGFDYDAVSTFLREVETDNSRRGQSDVQGTIRLAENYIKDNNLEEDYQSWRDSLEGRYGVKEYIFNGYTDSGNQRWLPHTTANASKWMKKQGREGATGTFPSFGLFVATVIPRMTTLNTIRKRKGHLGRPEQEYEAFKEKWENVYFELGQKLQPDAERFDDYGWWRLIEAVSTNNPKEHIKKQYSIELSAEDMQKLNDMLDAIKSNYPARYFETKFERPVELNEFIAAIVPNDIPADVEASLQEAYLNIYKYDKGVEGSRQEAVLEATDSPNVRFSLRLPKVEYASLSSIIMTRQHTYQRPSFDYAFTAHNFYVYDYWGDGVSIVNFAMPIVGNEEIIDVIYKAIDNGTINSSRSLDTLLEEIQSGKRGYNVNIVNALKKRGWNKNIYISGSSRQGRNTRGVSNVSKSHSGLSPRKRAGGDTDESAYKGLDTRLSMPMPDDIFFDDNGDIITFGGDDVREATTIVRRAPKTTEERIKMYMESRHYDSQRVSSGSFI